MSKRADPNSGQKSTDGAPRRVRQMTVYDRMEDARKRRHILLAKGEGPAPRHAPNIRASSETIRPTSREITPPPTPTPRSAPVTESSAPLHDNSHAAAAVPQSDPIVDKTRSGGSYLKGLLQAMAAIAVVAVLFAVFGARPNSPEVPAIAATSVQEEPPTVLAAPAQPQPPTIATTSPQPSPPAVTPVTVEAPTQVPEPSIASFAVQNVAPTELAALDTPALDIEIAPLINPIFNASVAVLLPHTQDSLPQELDAFPPFERLTPPIVLARTPPARPVAKIAPSAIAPPVQTAFAETTNVVLLVPAFVPQAEAESVITTAAALGIPVDQTRRANVSISRTNIRYFHAEDAEAATILADGLGGLARDFTTFRPPPSSGVIEIWIEGRGGSSNTNQSSAATRGIAADLQVLRDSIQRALNIATGN